MLTSARLLRAWRRSPLRRAGGIRPTFEVLRQAPFALSTQRLAGGALISPFVWRRCRRQRAGQRLLGQLPGGCPGLVGGDARGRSRRGGGGGMAAAQAARACFSQSAARVVCRLRSARLMCRSASARVVARRQLPVGQPRQQRRTPAKSFCRSASVASCNCSRSPARARPAADSAGGFVRELARRAQLPRARPRAPGDWPARPAERSSAGPAA